MTTLCFPTLGFSISISILRWDVACPSASIIQSTWKFKPWFLRKVT